MSYYRFPRYVSVAEKRARAQKKIRQLKKKNPDLAPVIIEGNSLARHWWGKSWNANLERYADYENRIGRGRSYVRHMAVLDLSIEKGRVDALVQGSVSKPYSVEITITALSRSKWKTIISACTKQLGSLQDLLAGRFPKSLKDLFMQKGHGLFPSPEEIRFSCSCPDWAYMCKHVAAVLYGVGVRLDQDPSLFFDLRQVNMDDLIVKAIEETSEAWIEKAEETTTPTIEDKDIGAVFGIDMDAVEAFSDPSAGTSKPVKKKKAQKNLVNLKDGKPATVTAMDERTRILDLVKAAPNGITAGRLHEKSGINTAKIRTILSTAVRKGDLMRASRGVYQAVRPIPKTPAERRAAILSLIELTPEGIRAPEMTGPTGLSLAAIRPMISRLTADGKIRRISRGVYGPAKKRCEQKQTTIIDAVFNIISRYQKGVSVSELIEKSGCMQKQINNILYRLVKKGKVRNVRRGVFEVVGKK